MTEPVYALRRQDAMKRLMADGYTVLISDVYQRQRDGVAAAARNLRNIGEAHRDGGDDPVLSGLLLDSGVIPEAPLSAVFLAAADALDELFAGGVS